MQFYRREKKYTEDNIQDYLRDWIETGNVSKFYGTGIWKAKRDAIMRRDGCMCQLCRMQGVQTPAVVVHHIEHVEDNPAAALDDANLLSLCKFCHKVVHKGLAYVLSYWNSPPAWAQELQQIMFFYLRQQQQQQAPLYPPYHNNPATQTQPYQIQQDANQLQLQQQTNNTYQQQRQGQLYPYPMYQPPQQGQCPIYPDTYQPDTQAQARGQGRGKMQLEPFPYPYTQRAQ